MAGGIRTDGIRTVEDIRQRCVVDDITGCWHWGLASSSRDGQPSMWLPAIGRTASVGVAICVIKTGQAPKPGRVWHCTCTTRGCANPDHRKEGDRRSQMLAAKLTRTPLERARITAGKRRNSKLSEADIHEIVHGGLKLREIVERYGISTQWACLVRQGKVRAPIAAPSSSVFAWRPA